MTTNQISKVKKDNMEIIIMNHTVESKTDGEKNYLYHEGSMYHSVCLRLYKINQVLIACRAGRNGKSLNDQDWL